MARGVSLSIVERAQVALGVLWRLTNAEIARSLGRDPSVVSRETSRNGGLKRYSAMRAQRRAETMRKRPKQRKIVANAALVRRCWRGC
jgi:transposase, IS30 family